MPASRDTGGISMRLFDLRHVGLWAVVLGLSTSFAPAGLAEKARATAAQKRAATEAFSNCREVAKEGDATGCWRVWLKKYAEVGTEAEVAYAEEHSGQKGAGPAVAAPPPASAATTATAKPPPPPAAAAAPPSASATAKPPAAAPAKCEEQEDCPADTVCEKGSCTQAAGAASAGAPPPRAPGRPAPPGAASGEVFDLCALKPRADSTRFVKQRVVVFAPAGADAVEQDPEIKKLQGARLAPAP
jgi:hypothetical protein